MLTAPDREHALNQLGRFEPPVVLPDLGLPPEPDGAAEGMVALQQIVAMAPSTKVIVITGNEDQTNAITAIGLGAFDFHHKPFEEQTLQIMIDRAYRVAELGQENRAYALRSRSDPRQGLSRPILKALWRSKGNVAQAAALLGIARPTLYDLMNQLGLK